MCIWKVISPFLCIRILIPSQITNNYARFYAMWLIQLLTCVMLGIILMTPALFFIGMCLYIGEMVADLRATLVELDAASNVPPEKIIDEILFHNDLLEYTLVYVEHKKSVNLCLPPYFTHSCSQFTPSSSSLAKSVGDVMSACLFFQLLVCVASLAVFMLGMETNRALGVNFFASMFGLSSMISTTYVYCLFSEQFTHDLTAIAEIFYNFTWYRLRSRQKLFIMPIQRANKALRITGFGLVECSLTVFASVGIFRWLWIAYFCNVNDSAYSRFLCRLSERLGHIFLLYIVWNEDCSEIE